MRLIHIRGARALTVSLYTGRQLTSLSCQFISLVNCFCVEFIRSDPDIQYPDLVPDPPDVAPNYPDSDPVGKNISGTPLV